MCGAYLGSSEGGGAGRDLIITVGAMAPGFPRWTTISGFCSALSLKVGSTLMLGI